jgi:hypothetical protein
MQTDSERFMHINEVTDDGQIMCALINGETGWLMYLRYAGDPGFSSRNPSYAGPPEAMQEYCLNNGQLDEYPLAWALPTSEIFRALDYFKIEKRPAPWIAWHNDSEDGTVLGPAV